MTDPRYLETARLLVRAAPLVFAGQCFALKGGTAINLFVRQMPRLSVDLDLVYLDRADSRDAALARIGRELGAAAQRLERSGLTVRSSGQIQGHPTKLLVRNGRTEVKVEVNHVIRGTVEPVERRTLTQRAQDVLAAEIEAPVVSIADLYGGKLVAALDRQHPRDLFDAKLLLEHEGVTAAIRRAFVVYLASHNRPIHEVLFSAPREIGFDYERSFRGMAEVEVGIDALIEARATVQRELQGGLDANERSFLCSLARAKPRWEALGIDRLADLPALRWKLENITKLRIANPGRFEEQAVALEERLLPSLTP